MTAEQQEILEGSNEICKFLKFELVRENIYRVPNNFPHEEDTGWTEWSSDCIGFHTDWNMLMLVVEKIDSFEGITISLKGSQFQIRTSEKIFKVHTINIKNSIYKCVTQFAKWYNQQQTDKHSVQINKDWYYYIIKIS